jgi:mono/diheme cytochrome c family protein
MMREFTGLLIVGGLLMIAAPVAAQDKVAAGQKLFADNKCSVCHSVAGVGNKKFPLEVASKMKAEEIKAWLVDAKAEAEKAGKKLALPMKSYKTLPAADLDALAAYIQSLK